MTTHTTTGVHRPYVAEKVQIRADTWVGPVLVGGYTGIVTAVVCCPDGCAVEVTDPAGRRMPVWVLATRTTSVEEVLV